MSILRKLRAEMLEVERPADPWLAGCSVSAARSSSMARNV